MLSEINILDSSMLGSYAVSSLENDGGHKTLYEAIFAKLPTSKDCSSIFGRVCPLKKGQGTNVEKSPAILPIMARIDGSGEVEFKMSWGGKDGVDVSIGASGEIHDDKGTYVEVEVSQKVSKDGLGEGNASVSAGHE